MKQETGACIVELRGKYAAVLTEDGRFVRIRNRGYALGQTVRLEQAKPRAARRMQIRAFASMAAGLLVLILGGFKGYQTPAGIVSLDVNPSIEYTINCFDRVLRVDAVNDDGESILEKMDQTALVNLSVEDAVEQTIETLRENGYLKQETENDVVLSASSYSEQHAERLAEQLETRVALQQDLAVTSISVTSEEVEQAHTLGASAGKLYIVEQLEQSGNAGESFSQEDWLEKPVREILQKTQEQESQTPSSGDQQGGSPLPQGTLQEAPDATPNPLLPQATASPDGTPQQGEGQFPEGSGPSSSPAQGGGSGKPSSGSNLPPHR